MAVIGVGFLLSAFALVKLSMTTPAVLTALYAFLTIQLDGASVLDFCRCAVLFFFTAQHYEWRDAS